MHKQLVKIGRVVRKICSRTEKKNTHRQADTLITILSSPIGGGIIKFTQKRRFSPELGRILFLLKFLFLIPLALLSFLYLPKYPAG